MLEDCISRDGGDTGDRDDTAGEGSGAGRTQLVSMSTLASRCSMGRKGPRVE